MRLLLDFVLYDNRRLKTNRCTILALKIKKYKNYCETCIRSVIFQDFPTGLATKMFKKLNF